MIHDSFKLVRGNDFTKLAKELVKFIDSTGYTAHSIGVEHLHNGEILMSLGYVPEDGQEQVIKISKTKVGTLEQELTKLEDKMFKTADKTGNVICHEVFVDEDDNVYMVALLDVTA